MTDPDTDTDTDTETDNGPPPDADPGLDLISRVTRRAAGADEARRANRGWWDGAADWYQGEHGEFLRDAGFIWCPEGVDEAEVHLLGPVRGRRVLEVGCGAGQCTRWLMTQGADAVGFDLSASQLLHSRRLDERSGVRAPVLHADATRLPFADCVFDIACSAFGAVPFVADSGLVMAEVARVLRPGGRWVFSTNHPMSWCFPDDPGLGGLVARDPYFDRRPYVEQDEHGRATYVEQHRTLGDRVREIRSAGLVLEDLIEPEWPEGHARIWGQWSPLRGRIFPSTAIYVTAKRT